MNDKYPLYPSLTEEGKREAQRIMDSFKPAIKSAIDAAVSEVMSELYTDVSMHVESDHWDNYRLQILYGFKNYKDNCDNHPHDFKALRQAIYENNKDEIVRDLNQDLVDENEKLSAEVKRLQGVIMRDYGAL